MSEIPNGPGWWQAPDGKWYPHGMAPPPMPPARRRTWRSGHLAAAAVVGLVLGIVAGAVVAAAGDDEEPRDITLPDGGGPTAAINCRRVNVFMDPEADERSVGGVERALAGDDRVLGFFYLDRDGAYAEFTELFEDHPDFTEAVTPEDLPTSFKVELRSPDDAAAFQDDYSEMADIFDVVACPEIPG